MSRAARRPTRIPPKPASYNRAKPGQCRFCAKPIYKNGFLHKRAQWHPACALTWTIMNSPQDARRFVFLRDRGICAHCGTDCSPNGQEDARDIIQRLMLGERVKRLGKWQLDHMRPLFAADGNPQMWQLANMQTLCETCHIVKGVEDNEVYGHYLQ